MRLLLACLLVNAALLAAAPDPFLGSWRLNREKSRLSAAGPREMAVRWEQRAGALVVSVRGLDADGRRMQYEYRPQYDGNRHKASSSL